MIIHDAAGCVTEIKIPCTSNLQEAQKGQENGNTSRKSRLLTRNMIRRLEERLSAQNTTRVVCMSQDLSSYRVKNEMSGSANAIPVIKT